MEITNASLNKIEINLFTARGASFKKIVDLISNVIYRQALANDFIKLATIRAMGSGSVAYWAERITLYSRGLVNPQQSLPPRVIYVAEYDDQVVGFIAGHLTRRFNCGGELQWINTLPGFQHKGIASQLIKTLAAWFINQQVYKICVDPGNQVARNLYSKNGAADFNDHWMCWEDIRIIV